jgi:hypothetical protein
METKTFQVLEAKGTGIFIRYTDKASEGASMHYDVLMKKGGAPKAEAYRHEWIINRIRAKGFKASDKTLLEVINALYAVFWDEKKAKIRKDLIESRTEEIEYTDIRTFKLHLHLRSIIWEKKLDKWSLEFYPTKPKDARRRQEKSKRSKGLFAVWMAKNIKPVKNQTCTPKEANAYQALLLDHVIKQIEDKHKVLVPQTELEV